MERKIHTARLLVIALGCLPFVLQAQGKAEHGDSFTYFTELAKSDAALEHSMRHLNASDEMDYWVDQKNFEKAIKKQSYSGYATYLEGKRDAYLQHKQECNKHGSHSTYYFQMAAFYVKYGTPRTTYVTSLTDTELTGSAEVSVVGKKHF
ncbi:hypothetical protein [Spongiimicrobium sp. 3-5]|uniref:hypothetical protein n=1 Tax=Spongiimicrobium sp. 3-5 TaxID=3332596 RepID=UPI00397F909D